MASFATLAAASTGAIAKSVIAFSADHSLVFAAPHAGTKVVPNVRKSKAVTIFSNLATKYSKGLYWSLAGYTIYDSGGGSQFYAGGFTPTASATAMSVQVAESGFDDGLSSYTVSINADSSGIPGAALGSATINSTTELGTCCGIETATFKSGVPLNAGTPYWVVVSLDEKQQKAGDDGAWNAATVDQIDSAPSAYKSSKSGWTSSPTTTPPAFGVFSQ